MIILYFCGNLRGVYDLTFFSTARFIVIGQIRSKIAIFHDIGWHKKRVIFFLEFLRFLGFYQ